MSDAKHTPGPWRVAPGFSKARVEDADGICVGFSWGRGEETEANASLIAAAPDLLAAIKGAMHEINDEIEQRKCSGNDEYWASLQAIWERCDAAVRKAEGRK